MTPGPADPTAPRCSAKARERGDALAGTASTVSAFLLLEESGPWGIDALRDARLPAGFGSQWATRCAQARVRPLLLRRDVQRRTGRPASPGPRRAAPSPRAIFAAFATPEGGWLEAGTVTDPKELLDLDLTALADGRGGLFNRTDEPLFAVCTHGRHDACCAKRGRPVLRALSAAEPDATWAVSHIGGDRFAANLLLLGEGLYYGGLDDTSVLEVAAAHRAGRLQLDHLRGRSCWPMPVQAAEVALRRALGEDRRGAVSLQSVRRGATDAQRLVTLTTADRTWLVVLRAERGGPVRLTCSSLQAQAPVTWRADEVRELSTRGAEQPQ